MKDKIIEKLKEINKSYTIEELDNALELNGIEETQEFLDALRELDEDGDIYHTNKDRYMAYEYTPYRKGRFNHNAKGFGFVLVDGMPDIFISRADVNNALHDDIVLVEILSQEEHNKIDGRILKIIKRDLSTIVGEIYFYKNECHLKPDDSKLKMSIVIPRDKMKGTVEGHKAVVKLLKEYEKGKYTAEVIKILGHKNDPGVDILSIVYNYDIKDTFNKETIAFLEQIPEEVSEKDKIGRKDLTNEMIFTIDGDDTKDIDDAISIKKLENGNYELGVHIADVSYYVTEGSPLDKEAMERGTSVYLVDRVIPMLPHKLSNGICSLNPNVERLTISCVIEIDENAKIINYDIFESVIKSNIQMTYRNVNSILEDNIVPEGYEKYREKLLLMDELSKVIRKQKLQRGYLDFETNEPKILVDENCFPIDIILRERGRGENIIEDFMIMANECVAMHIFYMDLPFIYRIHEKPKEEKISGFLSFVSSLGYNIPKNIKDNNSKSIQSLLEFLKDKKEFKILSTLLLTNMQKAIYLPENLGHFGLASKCYTHFTSPIRRYPDTTVHRLLRTYLFNNNINDDTLKLWEEKLVVIADHSSFKEREAVECEREVESMKMAEYMEKHIGEEYEGIISGITNFGLFVQLDNLIEGLVHVNDMDDFYVYDERTQSFMGEKTKNKYVLGDRLLVKVKNASHDEKKIDFIIIKKI